MAILSVCCPLFSSHPYSTGCEELIIFIGATSRLPLDFEWNGFLKRNDNVLIDPSTPARSVDQIQFANQKHKSTEALVEGTLQRKGKIMRSYSTAYYVVTPSKYLHEFKDNDVSA